MTNLSSLSLKRQVLMLFFISMALMMFEVHLIRLYSVLMHHHLAFFVLSISLFGIGIGGLYAHLLKEYCSRKNRSLNWVHALPLLLMTAIMLAPVVLLNAPVSTPSGELFLPGLRWVLLAFLVCALPFIFGGMYLAFIFSSNAGKANVLYLFDLLGAGSGSLFALISLQYFGAIHGTIFIATILVVPIANHIYAFRRHRWAQCGAGITLGAFLLLLVSGSLGYLQLKGERYENFLYQKWNYYSLITVQDIPGWRGWRPSPNYGGPYPEHKRIRQDGRAPAFIVAFKDNYEEVEYLKWDITALPFYISEPEKALVIGAGGGRDVLTAKLFGVPFVRGLELNPNIAQAMRHDFKEFSGNIYDQPGVDMVIENARTFLRRDTDHYDLIFTSLADTQTANNQGAQILSENHLYTVQAFEAYWDRLTDRGFCTVVSGLAEDFLRHVSTVSKAMENKGVKEPGRHLIVILTGNCNTGSKGLFVAFSKQPIADALIEKAGQAGEKLGYELIWPSANDASEWTQKIGILSDSSRREQGTASMEKDFSPLDDNRPYIFYNTKPENFLKFLLRPMHAAPEFGLESQVFYLLLQIFFVIGVCVFLLMLTPLLLFRRGELNQIGRIQILFLIIFLMLGMGYMLVEIALLQHFFLLLGNPTLTFSLVLGILLSCSGLGSFIAGYFDDRSLPRMLLLGSCAAILIQLGVIILLPSVLYQIHGMHLGIRLACVLALIFVLATPMGVLFPTTIRLVDRKGLDMTCWAWGMNGMGSVFGIVGATILAINLGVKMTFYIGMLCYAVAFICYLLVWLHPTPGCRQCSDQ